MSSSSGGHNNSYGRMVVLDRDGTLVVDRDYLDDPDELDEQAFSTLTIGMPASPIRPMMR